MFQFHEYLTCASVYMCTSKKGPCGQHGPCKAAKSMSNRRQKAASNQDVHANNSTESSVPTPSENGHAKLIDINTPCCIEVVLTQQLMYTSRCLPLHAIRECFQPDHFLSSRPLPSAARQLCASSWRSEANGRLPGRLDRQSVPGAIRGPNFASCLHP